MRAVRILAIAALLTGAAAHAQGLATPPAKGAKAGAPPKLGASTADGRGRSVANDQQQVQSDKFQMRQDKANKDTRKYKKHERQLQRDQERVNTR